jgi:hypothetical protein
VKWLVVEAGQVERDPPERVHRPLVRVVDAGDATRAAECAEIMGGRLYVVSLERVMAFEVDARVVRSAAFQGYAS